MKGFEAFRNEYGFTLYKDNRTAVNFDMPLVVVTYICVLVSIATLIATLGIRGRQRWSSAIRASYAVAIMSIILACLFGHGWQTGEVDIKGPYVYRTNLPFEGKVGLRVALSDTNVTLEGYYRGASGSGYVLYSETMPWADFGQEPDSYNYYLQRGLPDPILKVIEFLTVDGGDLRWGRTFHSAGHYARVLLWTSFAFWIVTNILLFSVIVYGAYMFFLTGLTMILACVAYHACQNQQPLVVTFGDADLRISYGWSFWLTLVSGMITFILGLILIFMDNFAHDNVSEFFHLEKLADDEHIDINCFDSNKGSGVDIMDRRGSIVPPPPTERRGSIFLEPTRRQGGWCSDNIRNNLSFTSTAGFFIGTKPSDSERSTSKSNPLYSEDSQLKVPKVDYHEDDVRIDMERVCVNPEVCMNTKKPSLATMKEHRDNHANERLSSSSPPVHDGKKTRSGSCQEGITRTNSVGFGQTTILNMRRESCPGIVLKPANFLRQTSTSSTASTVSYGFPSEDNVNRSPRGEIMVSAETYSRQSSNESTSSNGGASFDSGHGVSCDRNEISEGSSSRNGSNRNSVSESETVINIDRS